MNSPDIVSVGVGTHVLILHPILNLSVRSTFKGFLWVSEILCISFFNEKCRMN